MPTPTEAHLKKIFHIYRHTTDFDRKGLYFSPTCLQICRSIPSYAASTREQIVQYSKDADKGNVPVESDSTTVTKADSTNRSSSSAAKVKPRGFYTIRPLTSSEHTFTDPSSVNLTTSQLLQMSKDEGWIGMRVDLWGMDQEEGGMLVKVQYWWREEDVAPGEEVEGDEGGRGWKQCLHDIFYLGKRDGTEGVEGEVLELGEK